MKGGRFRKRRCITKRGMFKKGKGACNLSNLIKEPLFLPKKIVVAKHKNGKK